MKFFYPLIFLLFLSLGQVLANSPAEKLITFEGSLSTTNTSDFDEASFTLIIEAQAVAGADNSETVCAEIIFDLNDLVDAAADLGLHKLKMSYGPFFSLQPIYTYPLQCNASSEQGCLTPGCCWSTDTSPRLWC